MKMQVIEATQTDIIKVKRSLTLRGLLDMFKDFHTTPLIPVVDAQDHLIGVVCPENLLDLLRPAQAKLFRNIPFMEMDEDAFDLESIPSMGELKLSMTLSILILSRSKVKILWKKLTKLCV